MFKFVTFCANRLFPMIGYSTVLTNGLLPNREMVGHDGAPRRSHCALEKVTVCTALIGENSSRFTNYNKWLSRAPWDGESTDAAGEGDDGVAVAVEGPLGVPGRVRAQSLEDAGVDGHRSRGLLVNNSHN